MSKWTHSICTFCWNRQNPHRTIEESTAGESEICCWCFVRHSSGIYLRDDPKETPCRGKHEK